MYLEIRAKSYFYPMTLRDLQAIVAQGEGLHIEFKRKLPEWEKLMREIVAFANTEGGVLLIGVADDGTISGTRDPREVEEALDIFIREYTLPVPDYRLETIPLSANRAVVAIHIPESLNKPHRALERPLTPPGQVLIRIADSSARASKEMVELLKFGARPRDMKVEYGDKEHLLMQYLAAHLHVTVTGFAHLAKIPRPIASKTLVHLAKANVIRIVPLVEEEDRFELVD
jgi:restriction endonuclease Mrr